MRWLIVLPFDRPDHMGVDFRNELLSMGHEVRTFAYRRNNPLYKNRGTKAAYQLFILRRLERLCHAWRPSIVLVIKGGPITPGLVRRLKRRHDVLFINFFPDNPLLMMPFDSIEAYDVFFTKERYALESLESVGLRNLYYLPMYCVPSLHHPVALEEREAAALRDTVALVGARYPYRERLVRELLDYPIRVWGPGWRRTDASIARRVAGGFIDGRAKLAVYCGATLSLN